MYQKIPCVKNELLDTIKNSVAAFGLTKLKYTYREACIRVRRSNDNQEKDIGFCGNLLDTAALLAFTGSNSGYISKWYDQSKNELDATQTTATMQPRIVNNGVLDTDGLYYNGGVALNTNMTFADTALIDWNTTWSIVMILDNLSRTGVFECNFSKTNNSANVNGFRIAISASSPYTRFRYWNGSSETTTDMQITDSEIRNGGKQMLTITRNGNNLKSYLGSTQKVNITNFAPPVTLNNNTTIFNIMSCNGASSYTQGNCKALILFSRDLSEQEINKLSAGL